MKIFVAYDMNDPDVIPQYKEFMMRGKNGI